MPRESSLSSEGLQREGRVTLSAASCPRWEGPSPGGSPRGPRWASAAEGPWAPEDTGRLSSAAPTPGILGPPGAPDGISRGEVTDGKWRQPVC